ncbi:unnamed protein product [Didymodactylos carnosus]|uniref:Uncharacterized protein n=1 Tax=Didymodactylos carnosus TaxID=1234261 RepID=A0A8S2E4N2_9BILA|nr:unnamed protein product [Didymodactylos carnosus]CAF3915079.1 unnamed protein product [Didymodactylos carnosus]
MHFRVMTSSLSTSENFFLNNSAEPYTVIWLDVQVNATKENLGSQIKLRSMAECNLLVAVHPNKCEEYLHQQSNEKLILIISGQLGREFVPRVHDLPQLSAIYVYYFHKEMNEKWAEEYKKIKAVITDIDELFTTASTHQKRLERMNDQLSYTALTGEQSSSISNAEFM